MAIYNQDLMIKDFDRWNNKKKGLHELSSSPFYHEREVWWCSLGVNVGSEQDGTGQNFDRPVIVIKGFNKNILLAIALTGKKKKGKYYFPLGEIEGREASAVLSQIRLIDSKRLVRKSSTLNKPTFEELKKALSRVLLGF